eukprot:UC4_evm1s790
MDTYSQIEMGVHLDSNSADGLTTAEATRRREQYGPNEIQDRSKTWKEILWEQLYGENWYPDPIPAMMWTAMIVSLAIQDMADVSCTNTEHVFR